LRTIKPQNVEEAETKESQLADNLKQLEATYLDYNQRQPLIQKLNQEIHALELRKSEIVEILQREKTHIDEVNALREKQLEANIAAKKAVMDAETLRKLERIKAIRAQTRRDREEFEAFMRHLDQIGHETSQPDVETKQDPEGFPENENKKTIPES